MNLVYIFDLILQRSHKGVPISAEITPNEPRTGNAV
jgi:hypothetical protein